MPKRPKPLKLCAYCGELKIPTRDHLFPECIHAFGLPIDPIIVPACVECANQKSKFDSILRDALANDVTGCESPFARKINLEFDNILTPFDVNGPVIRSIRRGRSKFANAMVKGGPSQSEIKIFRDSEGISVVSSKEANGLFLQALEWISRGLFFHFTGRQLALQSFRCRRLMPCDYPEARRNEEILAQQLGDICVVPINGQGVPTAGYRIGVCADSDQVMFLTLIFWNCVVFEIVTNAPCDVDNPDFTPPSLQHGRRAQVL